MWSGLKDTLPDHYRTLGLHRRCTDADIRTAYRLLARQHHPDLNGGDPEAEERTRALNAAYAVLGDPESRSGYDAALAAAEAVPGRVRMGRVERDVRQDVLLRVEEFLRGTRLEVRVQDPANAEGTETYELEVPAGTAPGTVLVVSRTGAFRGGRVRVRLKAGPDHRFRVRGSDLACDLRISPERAVRGGTETLRGVDGGMVRVVIPENAGRGEVVRVAGEGLPRVRGGRGDLLVRLQYRPVVQVRRTGRR